MHLKILSQTITVSFSLVTDTVTTVHCLEVTDKTATFIKHQTRTTYSVKTVALSAETRLRPDFLPAPETPAQQSVTRGND